MKNIGTPFNFPAEFWVVFNAKYSVRPLHDGTEIFKRYQLLNQSDDSKYGPEMDMLEMIDFMNKQFAEYERELERIILG